MNVFTPTGQVNVNAGAGAPPATGAACERAEVETAARETLALLNAEPPPSKAPTPAVNHTGKAKQ